MSKKINFDAQSLIQSQSQTAPFLVIFESDNDLSVVYAVLPNTDDGAIVDQVIFNDVIQADDVILRWNENGDRAGIIINERLNLVFDFEKHVTYSDQLVPSLQTSWARQSFEFSNDLAVEFGIDKFFKQPQLDAAVDALIADPNQTNRLLFYKSLLTSKVFVPITTNSPDDPNSLIYTFPNSSDESINGDLICGFSNSEIFNQQIGQHGLSFQKISADYLCLQAQSFDNILGITITSSNENTVLLTRDEFKLLALISQPQRLDTQTLLKELGNVFFTDVMSSKRDSLKVIYKRELSEFNLIRAAYMCVPNVQKSKPLFCLVLKSTSASDELTKIVNILKDSEVQSQCDCHVFSLSDIVAQALEQSKVPL